MRNILIVFTIFAGIIGLCAMAGLFKQPAHASNEDASGGVTIQETPQELETTPLNSRYANYLEPSPQSEHRYVLAIRNWLNQLPPAQRETTRAILREAHPEMHDLRVAIREKKAELAALSFDRNTPPETLPRLGQELQKLRDTLKKRLADVEKRLEREAGITMAPLGGEGFWLAPPIDTPYCDIPLAGEKLPAKSGKSGVSHAVLPEK